MSTKLKRYFRRWQMREMKVMNRYLNVKIKYRDRVKIKEITEEGVEEVTERQGSGRIIKDKSE